jgi:hypothetical protein
MCCAGSWECEEGLGKGEIYHWLSVLGKAHLGHLLATLPWRSQLSCSCLSRTTISPPANGHICCNLFFFFYFSGNWTSPNPPSLSNRRGSDSSPIAQQLLFLSTIIYASYWETALIRLSSPANTWGHSCVRWRAFTTDQHGRPRQSLIQLQRPLQWPGTDLTLQYVYRLESLQ